MHYLFYRKCYKNTEVKGTVIHYLSLQQGRLSIFQHISTLWHFLVNLFTYHISAQKQRLLSSLLCSQRVVFRVVTWYFIFIIPLLIKFFPVSFSIPLLPLLLYVSLKLKEKYRSVYIHDLCIYSQSRAVSLFISQFRT